MLLCRHTLTQRMHSCLPAQPSLFSRTCLGYLQVACQISSPQRDAKSLCTNYIVAPLQVFVRVRNGLQGNFGSPAIKTTVDSTPQSTKRGRGRRPGNFAE